MAVGLLCVVWVLLSLGRRSGSVNKQWPTSFKGDPPTLVFARNDLQKIWEWEIESGHYPSRRKRTYALVVLIHHAHGSVVPEGLGLRVTPINPALPPSNTPLPPPRLRQPPGLITTTTIGNGSRRVYPDIQAKPPNVAFPPRPIPGSVADLDLVMDHCDFSEKKVRLN